MTVTGLLEVFYLTISAVFIERKRGEREGGRKGGEGQREKGREGGRERAKEREKKTDIMNCQLDLSSLELWSLHAFLPQER